MRDWPERVIETLVVFLAFALYVADVLDEFDAIVDALQ